MKWFLTVLLLAAGSAVADDAKMARLIRDLKDPDAKTRANAAKDLQAYGPAAKAAVPALAAALKDEQELVRFRAAMALEKIGPDGKAAVPALNDALKGDASQLVRDAAWKALESVRAAGIEKDGDGAVFGLAGPEGAKAIVYVVDRGPGMEAAAKPVKEEIVKALAGLSRSQKFTVVWAAEGVPARFAGFPIPATDENRTRAAKQLEDIKPAAKGDLAPAILEAYQMKAESIFVLTWRDLDADGAAAVAGRNADSASVFVVALSSAEMPVFKNLQKLAGDNRGKFALVDPKSLAAPMTGATADAKPETAEERLVRYAGELKSSDPVTRGSAARGLGTLGRAARKSVPALADLLKDKDEEVRIAAAGALEKIGRGADEALSQLTDALTADTSPAVRDAAWSALEKVRGPGGEKGGNGAIFGAAGPAEVKSVIYVFDRAAWMEPVAGALNEELAKGLATLTRGQNLNVLWNSEGSTTKWSNVPVAATDVHKADAARVFSAVRGAGRSDRLKVLIDALASRPGSVYFVTAVDFDARTIAAITNRNGGRTSINVVGLAAPGDPRQPNLEKLAADNGGKFARVELKALAGK